MRRLAAAVLAISCLCAALTAPAHAYVLEARPSVARVITYYNGAGQDRFGLARAVRAWSNSGARVEFVPVPRAEAEVVVGYQPGLGGETAQILSGDGDVRPGSTRVRLPHFATSSDAHSNRFLVAVIAVHELGHALGLGHEDGTCAVMNSEILNDVPEHCPAAPGGKWRCGLLSDDDIRGAVALYGGRPRRAGRMFCDTTPAPPKPPSRVRVSSSGSAVVAWRNPPSSSLLSVVVARVEGGCPERPAEGESRTVSARPDSDQSVHFPLRLGRYCYALWSKDARGKLSAHPATAFGAGPAAPSPPRGFSAISGGLLASSGLTSLRWTDPDDPTLTSVDVARHRGSCPSSLRGHWIRRPVQAGAWHTVVDFSFHGPGGGYCYAAWSRDRFGRYSRRVIARV